MGVAYVNPMTGQQINLLKGAKKPSGFWTAVGEVPDERCQGYVKLDTITQPINTAINSADINMEVGKDFTEDDDKF